MTPTSRLALAVVALTSLSPLLSAAALHYWVDPCTRPETGCRTSDPELAQWAFEAWQAASDGKLTFEKAAGPSGAQIRIHWVTARDGLYGEAVGGDVYVRPDAGEGLLRETITYLTCVHETGHALGLSHTAEFADIMYSFQFGGDITEYFARYRRKLSRREDIRKNSGISPGDKRRLVQLLSSRGDHRPRGQDVPVIADPARRSHARCVLTNSFLRGPSNAPHRRGVRSLDESHRELTWNLTATVTVRYRPKGRTCETAGL